MYAFIIQSLSYWHFAGYILIFLGMIIEGDAVLFAASFLAYQGFFNPFIMAGTAFLGVLFGDFLWYWAGSWIKTPSFFFWRWVQRIAQPFDAYLKRKPFRTIFVSKFAYGVHHALLFRAGVLGIRLTELAKVDFLSTSFWMSIVIGLGYASGVSFAYIKHYFRFAEFILLAGFIVFVLIEHIFVKTSGKKL